MPLALEHWPPRYRGLASGLLQGGWHWGFIVSALTFHFVYPIFSQLPDPFSESLDSTIAWRVMFWTGVIPALLVLWIRSGVSESPVWLERQRRLQARADRVTGDRVSLVRLFRPDLSRCHDPVIAVDERLHGLVLLDHLLVSDLSARGRS